VLLLLDDIRYWFWLVILKPFPNLFDDAPLLVGLLIGLTGYSIVCCIKALKDSSDDEVVVVDDVDTGIKSCGLE
jgi:hypothetical protein